MPATINLTPRVARRRRAALSRAAAALLLAALTGACGASEDKFAPACPALSLVPNAGRITRYVGALHEPAAIAVQAVITAVPAECAPDSKNVVKSTLHVQFVAARGPAGNGADLRLPYFVAVAQGDQVLREQDFSVVPSFGANSRQADAHGDDIELLFPVTKTKSAAAYHIYVGFRLTPEELAENRGQIAP